MSFCLCFLFCSKLRNVPGGGGRPTRLREGAFSAQQTNGPAHALPPPPGPPSSSATATQPTSIDPEKNPQIPFATVSLAAADPNLTARCHVNAGFTSPSRPSSQNPGASPRLPALLRAPQVRQPVPQTLASWARSGVEEHWGRERGSRQPSRPPPASTTPPTLAKWASQIPTSLPFVSTRPLTSPMPSAKSMFFCSVPEYCHLLLYQSQRNLASCLFFLLYKAYAPPPTSLPICSCPVE